MSIVPTAAQRAANDAYERGRAAGRAEERADIVAWMLEDKLPARFQLQMHKFIWEPRARGV